MANNLDVNLPSPSTSYANNNSYVYDIFINHRGPDCKKTLATDLYDRLSKHGLKVFLDQQELQEGDSLTSQIEGAIRTASVHIAIFSPRYVESTWCLKELVLMLDSRATIIPVFYGVKPSELRWTQAENGLYAKVMRMLRWAENGVYAQALLMLQQKKTFDDQTQQQKPRYDSNTIRMWRAALSKVADISGFDLDTYNRDKQQLLEQVVEGVLKKVKMALHVSKYPTGLDKKVNDFERTVLLRQQSGEVRVIGIVGLSGVGKTTLAKEIFNRQISNYSRSCCLLDVREKPLIILQSILLKKLAQFNEQIYSVDDGIEKFTRYLSSLHALVILDDVNHVQQLDALLLPMKNALLEGSLILVTSSNKDVLANSDIADSSIYRLKGLDRQLSRELFCWHAFSQPHPEIGFEKVVESFLDKSDELPLSLAVVGASLRGKNDLSYWEAQLRKFSKILPDDIQSRLKISFDGLDQHQKEIFLDIACFFIGEDMDTAIRIWDGSGWEGWLGFQNLENMDLVEVDRDNCIRMHGHLRDLGRDIAKKEPWHRIWSPTDNLLHNMLDQSPVRGIHMVEQRSRRRFENPVELDNRFLHIRMLELLRVEGNCLKSVFGRVQSPHLKWLRWDGCPYDCLPPWIQLESLRVLQMKGSKLKTLWGGPDSQAPLQLRELNIVDAPLLRLPKSIGKLKHLEKIVLTNGHLQTLPEEFCHLQCLKHLGLKSCSEMKTLPDSFGKLTKLKHIDLSECITLQMLPNSFGDLVQLQHLELKSCLEMKSLPDSFGKLTKLQHIDLSQCINLQMLPNSFGNLVQLQHLGLKNCSEMKSLPVSFGKLTKLQHVDLSQCINLQMLPNSFGNLVQLQHLELKNCSELKSLPVSFGKLTKLQHVDLSQCINLQMLPNSFGNLVQLQHLELKNCSEMKSLPVSFGKLTKLQHVDLSQCKNLEMLPDSLGNLVQLQHLYLNRCCKLTISNKTFGKISTLEFLDLSGCSKIQVLPPQVGHNWLLRELIIRGTGLKELPTAIGELIQLEVLILDIQLLKILPPSIGYLRSLQRLELLSSQLKRLPESIGDLKSLKQLRIKSLKLLECLPHSIGYLTSLEELVVWNCSKLKCVPDSIRLLTQLRELKIGQSGVEYLPPCVMELNNLARLEIEDCSLSKLPFRKDGGARGALKSLNVGLCIELPWLPSLETLAALERLEISGCCKLKSIKGLAQLTKLRTLEVPGCHQLEELEGVEHSMSLKRLNASACPKLQWDRKVMGQLRQRLKKSLIM